MAVASPMPEDEPATITFFLCSIVTSLFYLSKDFGIPL
jgi:hypothetical protein